MPLREAEILSLTPAITPTALLLSMGVAPGKSVRPRLLRLVDEAIEIAFKHARPRLVWRMGSRETVAQSFPRSHRLQRYLEKPTQAALVAATAGEAWQTLTEAETDPMKAYLFSAVGTTLARSTLLQARREIAQRYPGARVGDSLSSGTDGLPLKLQKQFAALLPLSAIGIQFDPESLLMTPLASVTAIIAWGDQIEREEPLPSCGELIPRCERCPSSMCQLRVQTFVSENVAVAGR